MIAYFSHSIFPKVSRGDLFSQLLGLPLTLTCCVGVAAMLEPGVQVQVQWTDSSNGAVAGHIPYMGSGFSYTSLLTLVSIEESNVGVNYTCTASLVSTLAFIDYSDTVSNSTTIPTQCKEGVLKQHKHFDFIKTIF